VTSLLSQSFTQPIWLINRSGEDTDYVKVVISQRQIV